MRQACRCASQRMDHALDDGRRGGNPLKSGIYTARENLTKSAPATEA
jgi:hypothetical protein